MVFFSVRDLDSFLTLEVLLQRFRDGDEDSLQIVAVQKVDLGDDVFWEGGGEVGDEH